MTTARATNRPFRFSREQYYKLGELGFFTGKRVERIRGEIIEMSPIGWPHSLCSTVTAEILREVFLKVAWITLGNPIPTDDSDPQPDVMVVSGQPRDYTDHPTAALLIVEVADTTLDRDTTIKAELYATAKVPDYWVLDLEHRQLLVFRDPVALPAGLGATAYQSQQILGETDSVSPLAMPSATIRVRDLLP